MRPSKRALERALGPDSDSGSSDWEYSSVDSLHEGQDKSTSPGEVCGHDQDEDSGKEEESGNKDSSDEDSDQDLVDEEVSGGQNHKEKALRKPCGGEIRYRCVHRYYGKFRAFVHKDGRRSYKYGFATAEQAARERDRLALLHEENPILNFLPDGSLNPERMAGVKGGDKQRTTVPRGDRPIATRPPSKDDKKARGDGKESEADDVRYRGVSWYKGAYRARMIADGKDRFLGTFDSKEDAAKAVDRAELQHYGDAALLNFLPDGTLNPERQRKKTSRPKTAGGGEPKQPKRKAEAEGGKRKKQKPLPDVSEGGDMAEEESGDGRSDEEDTAQRSPMTIEETEPTANLDGEEDGEEKDEEGETEQAARSRKTRKRHKERQKEKKERRGHRPRRRESEATAMDVLNILKAEAFQRGEDCQALWRELEKLSESLRDPTMSSEEPAQEYLHSFLAATVCQAYTEEQLHKQDLKEMLLQAAMWTVVHSAGIQGEG